MKETWYLRLGRTGIRLLDSIINLMMLLLFLVGLAFGVYALWDSQQLYAEAEGERYEQYKPIDGETRSFQELQKLNPDVFGWLTVYGTHIDYPIVQGEDNMTYVNTSASGESLLSGSIFLDYRNKQDFSDFNSIIHGHHMERQVMFGDIGQFANAAYFKEHQYGKIYSDGKDHGIEFFAFLHVDAYDSTIYLPAIKGAKEQQEYLEHLLGMAMYTRPVPVDANDHIVLLSTCASDATNGRHVLVGKLSDEVYDDPFIKDTSWDFGQNLWQKLGQTPMWLWIVLLLLVGLTLVIVARKKRSRRKE